MNGRNQPPARSDTSTPNSPVYRARHDPEGPARLSTTVAHAIADCMGVDVTDGTFSLYDSVDPDALDALFRPTGDGTPRTSGRLTFDAQGYHVAVDADGEILIEPPR